MSAVMQAPAREPGSIRTVHYRHGRGPDGKYPVTYWGTVEEQVQEATSAIARDLSADRHEPMDLFSFTDDCDHVNPEEDERFDEVEELVSEWLKRNCLMGADYPVFDRSVPFERRQVQHGLRYKNERRAYAVIPLANAWERAQGEYDDTHAGAVCLDSPMGSACRGCLEDEGEDPDGGDFGIEPCGCVRQERARERQGEFWRLVSAERAQRERN